MNLYQDDEILIRATKIEDLKELKNNLRKEDLIELKNFGHQCIDCLLFDSYEVSKGDCYSVFYKGKIAMIYGVKCEGDIGRVWLLSTDEVKRFSKKFLRLAFVIVDRYLEEYEALYNFIHPSNKMSVKLVKRLGAKFIDGFRAQKTCEPILKFSIERF
jgi:hypothetical protein